MATCGEILVRILESYDVDTVFGIPGVHTVELYRGLAHHVYREGKRQARLLITIPKQ